MAEIKQVAMAAAVVVVATTAHVLEELAVKGLTGELLPLDQHLTLVEAVVVWGRWGPLPQREQVAMAAPATVRPFPVRRWTIAAAVVVPGKL